MKFWQVDAFTNKIFYGNPAAVLIFKEEPTSDLMQKIAREMNLSETAFIIEQPKLKIRWFTPNSEVNLCGHATLSAAHILLEEQFTHENTITFQSKSGPLIVSKKEYGYTLDFPLQSPIQKPEYQEQIKKLIGREPDYIGSNGEDCMAVVSEDEVVRSFVPNHPIISSLS